MAKIISEEFVEGNRASICQSETGQLFFLASEVVTLKNGEKAEIYMWLPKGHQLKHGQLGCTMPSGYYLTETAKGLPVLKQF